MGLIENCNRVKQNVENIYTVLEENGIVIPEGTTSDNLSGLISTNTVNLDDELAEQDSLLAELQTTLEGKAAGGGGGGDNSNSNAGDWIQISSLPVALLDPPTPPIVGNKTYYLEVPSDCYIILFAVLNSTTNRFTNCALAHYPSSDTTFDFKFLYDTVNVNYTVADVSTDDTKILSITMSELALYALPIYDKSIL